MGLFDFFMGSRSEFHLCVENRCEHPTRPRGAHCNYQGVFLQHLNPCLIATDIHGVKDLVLSNPNQKNLIKISTVFPVSWDPMTATMNVMQALSSENKKIIPMHQFGCIKIVAYTQEDIEVVMFYDIAKKSLALFYPQFKEELL